MIVIKLKLNSNVQWFGVGFSGPRFESVANLDRTVQNYFKSDCKNKSFGSKNNSEQNMVYLL